MEVKPGYRQTEVGVIPKEWEVKRLGDVLTICHGKSQRDVAVADGPYPILATGGQIGTASRALYDKPSVLIGRKGTIDQPQYMETPFWTVDTLFYSAMKNGSDAKFFFYRFCMISWLQFNEASGVPSLNARTIEQIEIPCPEPKEQRAIAAALSDVDALLGGLDRLIAKTRDLKPAAMQQLLTGQTRLPGFSAAWEVKRLGQVADVLKGRALSKSLITQSGAHPCILYGELFTTYGRVISNVVSRTNSSEGCRSVAGDVLLPGSTTTTGADLATASALLIEDVALGGDIIIVRNKGKSYDPVFLASFLTHTAKHAIAELTQGITIHHLYGKDLKTLSLQLPSLPEQTAIAAVLSDMDTELAALEARRDKTRDLKQAMMQELLTGKTRLL